MNAIVYLENFIESTNLLPPELQRVLNLMKALDERCIYLSDALQQGTAQLLSLPPAHLQPESSLIAYKELSKRVEAEHKMLLQFAEEKVRHQDEAVREWRATCLR